jgi:hypothetical protein
LAHKSPENPRIDPAQLTYLKAKFASPITKKVGGIVGQRLPANPNGTIA